MEEPGGATTAYTYNATGELVRVEDAAGNVTRITYDRLGGKTAMNDPDMGHWVYSYEETISGLKREKKNFVTQLEIGQLTDEQIQTIKEFTAVIREELENVEAENDFDVKRRIIELLDVRVTVKVEDDQKVAYVQYKLGKEEEPIPIVDTTTSDYLLLFYRALLKSLLSLFWNIDR
ncbi:MAG: RHS repeat protein, partial [Planctomycetes bacterium]|nr:RHS repeat protein [Planctomycetota bacterium]